MNKHCYRLIFSKTLGFLIPVAETSNAQCKPGQTRGPSTTARASAPFAGSLKALPLALLSCFIQPTFAEILAEPGQRMSMNQSSSGVPVMEIADPNAKGLSHNRFQEFNVDKNGLIFNNSLRDGTSQIGGFVVHNPNLTREARAILTEVSGPHASTLAGILEVFGGKADILIANPNGITVNGVSTYNANGLTLSTGRAELGSGDLQLVVDETSGRVVIGSEGLNTEGLSYFDIVARGIDLNGAVGSSSMATDIQAVTGLNTYNTNSRTYSKNADTGSNTPVIAIDGSSAGSMYGRYISLISTESGAGVRHAGVLHSAQDIVISAAGDVQLNQLNSGTQLDVQGRDVTINVAKAGNDINLSSDRTLLAKSLTAGRDLNITSAVTITLGDGLSGNGAQVKGHTALKATQGIVIKNDVQTNTLAVEAQSLLISAAKVEAAAVGSSGPTKAISIKVGDFTLSGELTAYDNDGALLTKPIVVHNGQLQVDRGDGVYDDKFTLAISAMLLSGGGIDIDAKNVVNQKGMIKDSSTRGISITADNLTNSGVIQTAGDLSVLVKELNNLCAAGATIGEAAQSVCAGFFAQGQGSIKAGKLTNNAGLLAQNAMTLELGAGNHSIGSNGVVYGGTDLTIKQQDGQLAALTNAGTLQSGGKLLVLLDALSNAAGSSLISLADMQLQIGKSLSNAGHISVAGDLKMTAADIINISAKDAKLDVRKATTIQATNSLSNQKDFIINSGDNLVMKSGGAMSTGAYITVLGDTATIESVGALTHIKGSVYSTNTLNIKSGAALTNEQGSVISAVNLVTVETTGDLNNQSSSSISSGKDLVLKVGGTLTNTDSSVLDGRNVTITAASLINKAQAEIASYFADGKLSLTVTGDVSNEDSAKLTSEAALELKAGGTITNDKALINAKDLQVQGANVTNRNSGEVLGTTLKVTADTTFTSATDATVKGDDILIDSGKFDASGSQILANQTLELKTLDYKNTATVHSKKTAVVSMKDGKNLNIDSGNKNVTADDLLTINTKDLTVVGSLSNPGSIKVEATGNVSNNGEIVSGKSLDIKAAGSIENLASKLIWSAQAMTLDAGTTLSNGLNGMILSMQDLTLKAGQSVTNNTGRIEAKGNVNIDTAKLENLSTSSGTITTDRTVKSETFYTEDYKVFETQYFRVQVSLPVYAADVTVQQGVIKAGKDMQLNQGSSLGKNATVRNAGGLIAAAGDLKVDGDLKNEGASTSKSLTDILKAAHVDWRWSNSNGTIYPDGDWRDASLYDFLDEKLSVMSGDSRWGKSLKLTTNSEVNQVLSAVLGADWKAQSDSTLIARWTAFKAASPDKTQDFYAAQQAELSAGKAFVHTGGDLTNGTGANWGENRQVTVQIGDESQSTIDGDLDARFNQSSLFEKSSVTALREAINSLQQQWALTKNNPMFVPNPQPSGSGNINADTQTTPVAGQPTPAYGGIYSLYTTRVSYINQSDFYGSAYFLDKIGHKSDKVVTVLGDAYFDNELIVRTVEHAVGNFFATQQNLSDTSLVKNLMDNAASQTAALGLVLGQPLTQAQYDKLTNDIVWYEQQEVNGVTVLAPKVYLSKKTLAARAQDKKSGALITAQTVQIDANSVNNINGAIRGTDNTLVYAKGNINNVSSGGADATIAGGNRGRTVLAAEGNVLNQGGTLSGLQQTVIAGGNLTSTATTRYDENGNLVSRNNGTLGVGTLTKPAATEAATPPTPDTPTTGVAKLGVEKPNVRKEFDDLKKADPLAADATSLVSVWTGGDINLIGAKTQADTVELKNTGNLNMKDLHEVKSSYTSSFEHGFLSSQLTEVMTAEAKSKGNQLNANTLTINTGGNWNITGSDVNAKNSKVKVDGDMTVAAGKDLAYYEKTQQTTQVVIGGSAGGGEHSAGDEARSFDTQQAASGTKAPDYSDQDINEDGNNVAGANQHRGETNGVNFRAGLEITKTKETKQDKTYKNSQLNLGTGSLEVVKTFDLGGADINKQYQLSPEDRAKMTAEQVAKAVTAMPTLNVNAGDIKSTKFEDSHKNTFTRKETFVGVEAEGHSAFLNVATHMAKTVQKAKEGMEIDPLLTTAAELGNVSQMVFGDAAGASGFVGVKHTNHESESATKSQNINQIGGNISLTTTKGDIALNGVNIAGGKVTLDSAGKIIQKAAESSSSSSSYTDIHKVGYTQAYSAGAMGAGAGMSIGAEGSYDDTSSTSKSYTNGLISGADVTIKAKGDHQMEGANIKAGKLDYQIDGNQIITSKQDEANMDHTRGAWSASVGVAVSSAGGIVPVASASGSGGKDYDDSKLTKVQSGIDAGSMDFHVKGNQALTGAHIVNTSGQGSYQVDGKTTATTLKDARNKDGGYGGAGAGMSKSGMPNVTVEAGRVDQIKYEANQNATVSLGGLQMNVAGGSEGDLNRDASKLSEVKEDRKIAGTDIRIEASLPQRNKKDKKANAAESADIEMSDLSTIRRNSDVSTTSSDSLVSASNRWMFQNPETETQEITMRFGPEGYDEAITAFPSRGPGYEQMSTAFPSKKSTGTQTSDKYVVDNNVNPEPKYVTTITVPAKPRTTPDAPSPTPTVDTEVNTQPKYVTTITVPAKPRTTPDAPSSTPTVDTEVNTQPKYVTTIPVPPKAPTTPDAPSSQKSTLDLDVKTDKNFVSAIVIPPKGGTPADTPSSQKSTLDVDGNTEPRYASSILIPPKGGTTPDAPSSQKSNLDLDVNTDKNFVSAIVIPPKGDTPDAPKSQKSTLDVEITTAKKNTDAADVPPKATDTDTPTAKAVVEDKSIEIATAREDVNDKTIEGSSSKAVVEDKSIEIATAKEVVNDKTVDGPSSKAPISFPTTPIKDRLPSTDLPKTPTVVEAPVDTGGRQPEKRTTKPATHSTNYDGYQQRISAARASIEASTGTELKKALSQLNSQDSAARDALKANPVNINIQQPNGKVVSYEIKDMGSLLRLNGQKVAAGDLPASAGISKTTAPKTELYIHVKPSDSGGYTYTFESTPPK